MGVSGSTLIRITAPHFVAGLELQTHNFQRRGQPSVCVKAAPIIAYMVGWRLEKIRLYCKSKGWEIEVLE